MEKNNDIVFFIVNPHAGNGKGRKNWPLIESHLSKNHIPHEFVFTERKQEAAELSESAVRKGYKTIIAVGGDGTLNEVANGILRNPATDAATGMIPVGSGNDWCRMFGISSDYQKCVNILKQRNIFVQDVGVVKCSNGNHNIERFFVNVAGLGFDAKVVQKTNRQKDRGRSGKMLYLMNLFTSLFSKNDAPAKITIDGKTFSTLLFSLNVGICKYSGGGMMQVPNAVADDGLFDVTVISKIGKFDVIRNVKNLYDGSFTKHKKVTTYRCSHISINTDIPVYIEIDGESIGHTAAEFSIMPKGLKIISG